MSSLQTNANIKWAKYSGAAWGSVETRRIFSGLQRPTMMNENIAIDLNGFSLLPTWWGSETSPCTSNCDNYAARTLSAAGGVWTDNTPLVFRWATKFFWYVVDWQYQSFSSIYISSLGLVFAFLGDDCTKTPAPFETQATAGGSWTPGMNIDACNQTTSPLGPAGCDGAVSIRYYPLRDNNK